ncbi:MAG: hypothetical protein EB127_04550 [Alphaproteobacteria bacterium]|nr:hypothetical protein [Alphaproteobacteria bacterium]
MSTEDHAMLFEIRERIARIEARQVHILDVLTENKNKVMKMEEEAHALKGKIWLISTIVFAFLAAIWEVAKNKFLR